MVKANIDDEIAYTNLKAEFTDYKKILCRSINEVSMKPNIHTTQEHLHYIKMISNRLGLSLKIHCKEKNNPGQLHNLFSTIVSSLI